MAQLEERGFILCQFVSWDADRRPTAISIYANPGLIDIVSYPAVLSLGVVWMFAGTISDPTQPARFRLMAGRRTLIEGALAFVPSRSSPGLVVVGLNMQAIRIAKDTDLSVSLDIEGTTFRKDAAVRVLSGSRP